MLSLTLHRCDEGPFNYLTMTRFANYRKDLQSDEGDEGDYSSSYVLACSMLHLFKEVLIFWEHRQNLQSWKCVHTLQGNGNDA